MQMVPTIQKDRPPFVRFEEREHGIDEDATKKAGYPIGKMVHFAQITTPGSKDVYEQLATVWIADKRAKAMKGEYPLEWVNHHQLQYDEWKKGNEIPREGTAIRTWQMTRSKILQDRIIAAGITTVEDLASVPDSGLNVIGMDGRHLRDMAATWVREAKDLGASAKAIADSNARIATLEEQLQALILRNRALEARLDAQTGERPQAATANAAA